MHLQTQHDAPVESKSCKLLEPFRLTVSRDFKEILKKSLFFCECLFLYPAWRIKSLQNVQLFFTPPLKQHLCLYFDIFSKPHFWSYLKFPEKCQDKKLSSQEEHAKVYQNFLPKAEYIFPLPSYTARNWCAFPYSTSEAPKHDGWNWRWWAKFRRVLPFSSKGKRQLHCLLSLQWNAAPEFSQKWCLYWPECCFQDKNWWWCLFLFQNRTSAEVLFLQNTPCGLKCFDRW